MGTTDVNFADILDSMDLGIGGGRVFRPDHRGGARDGGARQKLGVSFATGENDVDTVSGKCTGTWWNRQVPTNRGVLCCSGCIASTVGSFSTMVAS